jgi:hypothetical protein
VTQGTLERWRRVWEDGPPWYKLGPGPTAPVRYDAQQLATWIARQASMGNTARRFKRGALSESRQARLGW